MGQGGVSRRTLLVGGGLGFLGLIGAGAGTAELVDRGVLPGRARLESLLHGGGSDGTLPDIEPGPTDEGSFTSAARAGVRTQWLLLLPPGQPTRPRLPTLVVLHGRGGDAHSVITTLGLDRFLAAAVKAGVPPFAIVGVDGGRDSYWHPRAGAGDSGAMITDELLPLLGRRGLRVERPAYLGYSMGGYGALLVAERVGPEGVSAVVAESPALWRHARDTAAGAFDDAADFQAHDVISGRAALSGIGLRIDCGTGDPFYSVTKDFVGLLHPHPAGGFEPGAHTQGYWRRMAPAQLRFVGEHLSTA